MADGRTIIVSENRLLRDGIRQMLARTRLDVVSEDGALDEVIAGAEPDDQPELIVFHLGASEDGDALLETFADLHQNFPLAKLVVLADQCARPVLPALLHADVSAILFTQISSDTLERSLELVLSGHRLFPADIMAPAAGETAPGLPRNGDAANDSDAARGGDPVNPSASDDDDNAATNRNGRPPLSPRESEVVQCLADGLSNKTIARKLHITEGTVKVHVKGLLRKLRAANRTQLAIWALRHHGGNGFDGGQEASAGQQRPG